VNTASATAFTWKEMNALRHAVDPAYRTAPQIRWAFNDANLQVVEEMEDNQGALFGYLLLSVVPPPPF
jgi:HK97 family phage major capsid protein